MAWGLSAGGDCAHGVSVDARGGGGKVGAGRWCALARASGFGRGNVAGTKVGTGSGFASRNREQRRVCGAGRLRDIDRSELAAQRTLPTLAFAPPSLPEALPIDADVRHTPKNLSQRFRRMFNVAEALVSK